MNYELRQLLTNLKYSFLKFHGWIDAFHSDLYSEYNDRTYSAYVYGKRYSNVRIKKHPEAICLDGIYPWYVELEDGCIFNIHCPDIVLFLPWVSSKEGKRYWKEREKRWSTLQ